MSSLFAPNYSSAKFPEPREFQNTAHEKLRQGFKDGHRCQLLMAPTGSGKTMLSMMLIHESLKKGKRVIFVCDRTTLINQTSAVADSYGLAAHSIIQSGHWRFDSSSKFHIASVQTLARRSWPDVDLIIIDEAHVQYRAWTEQVQNCKAAVLALSATPFSQGLGRLFTNLINAATMHELTQSGVLVPMRVFSCTKINMEGAETSGGEWKDSAAAQRGMEIVGDVVTEWQKHAENRKTIIFGATIAHCLEMCRQFNESGIPAAAFTSNTTESERKELLDEFAKPDSFYRILLSVEALAKGFDCIAEGSKVLTHRGLVAIENVLYNDMLWDGCEFVPHGGVIYKGERDVITYSGLTATQDHLVKTAQGWIPFGECARLGIPIACTAYGECCVREDEGYFSGGDGEANNERSVSERELPVHKVRSPDDASREVASFWGRLQEMLHEKGCPVVGGGKSDGDEGKVYKSISQGIQKLWRAWNKVQFQIATRLCGLDHGKYSSANQGQEYPIGSDRQQWALRAGESSLGKQEPELRKYSTRWLGSKDSQVSRGSSGNTVLGQNFAESYFNGDESRANSQQVSQAFGQTKRRVWDILNAGPRNSFTCEGLLVHNCADVGCVGDCRPLRKSLSTAIQMWGRGLRSSPETGKQDCILLDFSGNIIRFADDFSDVFYNGLESLDMGEKLDKTIRRDNEEKEESKCPSCGFSPFGKRCISCGHERQKQNLVDHLPGEMTEIMIGKSKLADDKKHLYEQVCTYTRSHGNPETARQRAWYLFQDLAGCKPSPFWKFEDQPNTQLTRNTLNHIKRKQIAFAKASQRRQA